MARWTRRDFLKGAAAVAAAGAASSTLATTPSVRTERLDLELPGLDPAHAGLRVAQLSDIHVGALTPEARIREAVALANAFRPDLVVLTGDYLSRERRGVGLVREQLAGLEAPTVAVLGNHDHRVDATGAAGALARLGYAVLRNENTTLFLRGATFAVVGIDDYCTHNADPAKAMKGAPAGSRLVLAHDPATVDVLRGAFGPLTVLSGHTHGGQVNLPLARMREMPYKSGLFRLGEIQLYVNRGIGNTWLPFRVNAPPEVTLITLRPAAGDPGGHAAGARAG
jgi:predicted MPP superfamily phosphohydrolase